MFCIDLSRVTQKGSRYKLIPHSITISAKHTASQPRVDGERQKNLLWFMQRTLRRTLIINDLTNYDKGTLALNVAEP